MRRDNRVSILLCSLMIGFTGCSASTSTPDAPRRTDRVQNDTVQLGQGRDRTGSRTAQHWVSAAEHVAVVSVLSEVRGQPSSAELGRGEGLIGREIDARLDQVVWSAAKAFPKAPATIRLQAVGWVFNNNDGLGERRFALEGSPRLEPGHSYVVALDWVDDPCLEDPAEGAWALLGGGGIIPADGGVLGAGEFEGTVFTVDEARKAWRKTNPTIAGLRDQVVGSEVGALVDRLESATPRPARPDEGPACDRTEPD